jgi:hypothetical protein
VSHLRGRQHQEAVKAQLGGKDLTREEIEGFSLKHITDAPASDTDNILAMDRERQKALKKRCKKIRLRMAAKYVSIVYCTYSLLCLIIVLLIILIDINNAI